jgi:hypothetical protein
MKTISGVLLAVAMVFVFVPSSHGAPVFSDDFESGNLDNWIIGGRQLGTNIADVVSCGTGTLCGHLYHSSFTEITLHRDFQFEQGLTFSFDLEVDVSTTTPPAPEYYASSGVNFSFLDSTDTSLGSVWYVAATTNYPFTDWPSSTTSVNQIAENVMQHHEIAVPDMLSQIDIDPSQIAKIRMTMNTYGSTYPLPTVSAELWIDNVTLGSCGVYCATANAEAATYGSSSVTASGMFNELALLLVPVGAVILLRIWRRKR